MDTKDFQITRERSLTRGWLYTITHPDWADREPSYAVAAAPTPVALRDAVESVINEHTRREITEGFRYDFADGHGPCRVWLSTENQANYASYLKAVELGAESITLKVEDAAGTVCYTTVSAADYPRFYLAMVAHIQSQIQSGWAHKDAIDYTHLAALAQKV